MFEDSVSSIPSIWASLNSWFTPTVLFVLLNLMIATIFITSNLASSKQQNQNQNQTQTQNQNQNQNDPQNQTLFRSPSVLQRLRSINLYNFRSQELNQSFSSSNTHFKQIPDFNSHQQRNLETDFTETQSVFQQIDEPETEPHFIFQQTHEQEALIDETQFVFQQTHESKAPEPETHQQEDEYEEEEEDEEEEEEEVQSMDENFSHVSRTVSDMKPTSGEIPARLPAKMRKSASSKSAFGHFAEADIVEVRRPATVRERGVAKVADGDDEVDAKADDFILKFKQQLKLQRMDSIIRYKEMIGRGTGK